MASARHRLRAALLAGTLDRGGAEKQLVYMARALAKSDVEVRVYCLREGEFYEQQLRSFGIPLIQVGRFANPLLRLATLAVVMRRFQPHVIQSGHAFANLYAALVARLLGAISLGALRSSLLHSEEANGRWTRWLMKMPTGLVVNSRAASAEVARRGLLIGAKVHLIPNAIDLADTDADYLRRRVAGVVGGGATAIFIGRLVRVKRVERFLQALVAASGREPTLKGVVVGDGPERGRLERLAADLAIGPERVAFLGRRDDVLRLLGEADMLVLCSDEEGLPNVLLEAMAIGVPVITTSAGDARIVVQDGVTGYVLRPDDVDGMAERMVRLARSPKLRRELGEAGRRRVEQSYSFDGLAAHLLGTYRDVARTRGNRRVLQALGE